MNENFLDLSGRIDPSKIEVLDAVSQVAGSLGIPFFIVGAEARDLILEEGYDISTIRATLDIDFALCVSNWYQYAGLKESLLSSEQFTPAEFTHRLKHKDLLIDLIPFGPIAGKAKTITWPPQNEISMNVLGFEEVYESSLFIRVRSDPVLEVRIASLAGLVVTKLISWNDKYPDRARDAQDISLILNHYTDAGNQDRMFDEAPDLVEREDFDYIYAGARLLGRDIAKILSPETEKAILAILDRETGEQKHYRLVEQMESGGNFDHNLKLLEELKTGIEERGKQA